MEEQYQVAVVKRSLRSGPRSFPKLAAFTEGLYPSDLAALLQKEVLNGGISFHDGEYSLPTVSVPTPPAVASHLELPDPHPLDYDWRFRTDTVERIASRILSETLCGAHIALLGTPTLFEAIPRFRRDCRITLLDGSEELVRYLGRQRLLSGLTCKYADLTLGPIDSCEPSSVVMCDPPWYVEYYAAFLAQASLIAQLGATVFISLVPLCTRPDCERDRQEILSIAAGLGLTPYALEPGVLVYETPLFERESLAREGMNVADAWRRGDLLTLRKVSQAKNEAISRAFERASPVKEERRQWNEVLIGTRKLKLRISADHSNDRPELVQIETNDVLPTVSRRYPGRQNVDLWLWDNRVFKVTNVPAFWRALNIAAGRDSVDTVLDHRNVEIALKHLRRLL